MLKIKNGGLDQCGAAPFEQQQFGTVGIEGTKLCMMLSSDANSRLSENLRLIIILVAENLLIYSKPCAIAEV